MIDYKTRESVDVKSCQQSSAKSIQNTPFDDRTNQFLLVLSYVWCGLVWFGLVWFGLVWFDLLCLLHYGTF